ncbi:tyrosine-type recombinase/integrase [Verrucomicrobiota bacterium]
MQLYYTNGMKYRPAYGQDFGETGSGLDFTREARKVNGLTPGEPGSAVALNLDRNTTWRQFWNVLHKELINRGYDKSTLTVYRQVLRKLRDFGITQPAMITAAKVKDYISNLAESSASWSWVGTNISVLRNTFDKLGGLSVTSRLSTPKRPHYLPTILSPCEIDKILEAAATIRDQLLLGLMYGCGLKVGETCRLRWREIDLKGNVLNIEGRRARKLPLPPGLIPVLTRGVAECSPDSYIFQGRKRDTHLSTRMAELILRKAVRKTEIPKVISCMTLRHTYAVHQLENNRNVREVQELLGHKSIETTLLYQRCMLPKLDKTPLGMVRELMGNKPNQQTKPNKESRKNISPLLIPKTSSLEGLQLPFIDDSTMSLKERSREFYQTIKIRLRERFLT